MFPNWQHTVRCYKSGSLTIVAMVDFSKAFNYVRHSNLFHRLIMAGLSLALLVGLNLLLSGRRACTVFQNHKSHSYQVCQDSFVAQLFPLFSSIIFLVFCLTLSAALFRLTTWPSGPFFPRSLLLWTVEATQGALIQHEHWCLLFNLSKLKPPFS